MQRHQGWTMRTIRCGVLLVLVALMGLGWGANAQAQSQQSAPIEPTTQSSTQGSTQGVTPASTPPGAHGISIWQPLALPADFPHFPYANPNAPKGGRIVLQTIGSFNTFNPFTPRSVAEGSVGLVYDTLMTSYFDGSAEMYGLLAASLEVSEDRRRITFHLRPEARFQDGVPVTAQDVAWTFETIMASGIPSIRDYYAAVTKVEVEGDHAVTFLTEDVTNRELPLILGQLQVFPRHAWKDRVFDALDYTPPLGSGPYRVGKFEPNRFVEYERDPNYWGKDLPVNKGRHNFDVIRIDYYRDATVLFEAFRAGKGDYREENVSRHWATGYDLPAVSEGRLIKKSFTQTTGASAYSIVFNRRLPVYQDRRVREALNIAFDFERINSELMFGLYQRIQSFFDNSDLTPKGLPNDVQRQLLTDAGAYGDVPEEAFGEPFRQPAGDMRARLVRARDLLEQAGFKTVDGKLQTPDGQPFVITVLDVSGLIKPHLNMYAESLGRLGIDMIIRTVEPAQYIELVRNKDFNTVVLPLAHGLSPGNELTSYWGSEAAVSKGSANYSGIANGAIDYLITQVIAAKDRESLRDAVGALDRLLTWDYATVLLFYSDQQRLVYWNKFDYPTPSPYFGTSIELWWAKPDNVTP